MHTPAEAGNTCISLQNGLSCKAVAQRLGLPPSSLARWVRQARMDLGNAAPLNRSSSAARRRVKRYRLRKGNHELRREKILLRLVEAHLP